MKYYNLLPLAANYLITKRLCITKFAFAAAFCIIALDPFCLFIAHSFAQSSVDQNVKNVFDFNQIAELLENGVDESSVNEEIEELLEHYQKLRRKPLNINNASRGELKRLRVLSDFQIFALREHISSTGAVLSYAELELVYGFTPQLVAFLSPFICFGETQPTKKGFFKDAQSTLYSKYYFASSKAVTSADPSSKSPYSFYNDYLLLKYNMQYLNKLEIEYIMEKDAGEPYFGKNHIPAGDFISGSIALYNRHLGKLEIQSLILGDMKVSFGQGLTLCNTTSFGGASTPNGFMKNREPLGVYTSTNEVNYLRGIGTTISYKRLTVTPIVSYRGIDATLNTNGSYKTLKSDGLHTSESLIASQNSMNELVYGVNATVLFNKLKAGVSYCGYSFTRECAAEPKYYNQNRLYNGFHWNAGADFYTILYGVRIFTEVAYSPQPSVSKSIAAGGTGTGGASGAAGTSKAGRADRAGKAGRADRAGKAGRADGADRAGGAVAALLGANYTIGSSNIYLLARYYPANYIAPHSGAYSTLSYVANQEGVTVAADGRIWRKFYYGINASLSYYPYYRYNINCSSSNAKFSAKIGWSDKDYFAAARNEISCTFSYRNAAKYFSNGEEITALWSLKGLGKLSFCKWANLTVRGEYNSEECWGVNGFLNIATNNQKFRAHIGATWFNAPVWNGRIYLYEQDLPQTFSSSMLYGNGCNLSALLSYRPTHHISLHIKLSHKTIARSTAAGSVNTARLKTTSSETLNLRLGLQLFF